MKLVDIIDQYKEEAYHIKTKFPLMYEHAKSVRVIDWNPEFKLGHKNPEVLQAIQFQRELLKKNLISLEEYMTFIYSLPYITIEEGTAFIETNEVSFRTKTPDLFVVLHTLGHCYFKEPDNIWCNWYNGGEKLMWLIYWGSYEGNEKDIQNYMKAIKLFYTNPKELLEIFNNIASKLIRAYEIPIQDTSPIENLYTFTGFSLNSRKPRDIICSVLDKAIEVLDYMEDDYGYPKIWQQFFKELILFFGH